MSSANSPLSPASTDDTVLRAIVQGVEAETGERFFASLVQNLALALGVQYAFVTQLSDDGMRFRMLALWERDHFGQNLELPLKGTPCESVLHGHAAHYAQGLCALFPEDKGLVDWGAISYCGVPVFNSTGRVFGHVAIIDDQPMADGSRGIGVMRIFAARVRAEIERMRAQEALRESEARYRDLYEGAPSPIVSATPEGRFVRWNRRFLEWSGYTAEQMRSISLYDFWPQAAAGQAEIEDANRRWRNLEQFEAEFQLRIAGGAHRWVRAAIRPILNPAGEMEMSEVVIIDITDRKVAEEALRNSEERLSRVVDSAMDAIVTFDSAFRIELFNGAAENIFKVPASQAIGATLEQFLTPGLRRALEESMRAFGAAGAARPYVWAPGGLMARRADQSEFPIEATISQFEVGRRTLFTLILRDVDERRRAESELQQLGLQNEYLQEEIKQSHNFEEIVGQSPALSAVLDQVRLVAPTDSTVLIVGDTGTGKELIARAIHSASSRRDLPLIKVNCAALPAGLIESELFGHEKGAFTGATDRRVGRFELANGGTIFLDEIGEIPPEVQVKLLRVLQEREFERIGASATVKVDIRVIAATNRDLTQAVAEGKFRSDLFYRLNVFPLLLPPLRERRQDIPLLVHYFLRRYASRIGRKINRIRADTMARLTAYSWPGNIRELENVIERAVILSAGADLELPPELLPKIGLSAEPGAAKLKRNAEDNGGSSPADRSLADNEKSHILTVLKQTNWRIEGPNGAAALLKLNPSTLRSRMKKLGVQRSRDGAS